MAAKAGRKEPEPQTVTAKEFNRNFADILSRAQYRGERFVITRHGDPVARLEPIEPAATAAA